jgi:hypothetical protein
VQSLRKERKKERSYVNAVNYQYQQKNHPSQSATVETRVAGQPRQEVTYTSSPPLNIDFAAVSAMSVVDSMASTLAEPLQVQEQVHHPSTGSPHAFLPFLSVAQDFPQNPLKTGTRGAAAAAVFADRWARNTNFGTG